jgi:hypothetical protein
MTAVEWLADKLTLPEYGDNPQWVQDAIEQAKEMEKQQIGKAFLNGRLKEIGSGVLFDLQPLTETFHNYYNETFKTKKK